LAKKKTESMMRTNIYGTIALFGIFSTLFFAPFFRGLFFPTEQMIALMVLSVSFLLTWIFKISQREYSFLPTWMDRFALLFLLSYLISFWINPASKELAWIEFGKNLMFFFVFWSLSNLAFNQQKIDWSVRLLYYTGVAIGLSGLAIAMGWFYVKDGFVGSRIFGTLQYPNTTAALLLATVFLGLYLYETDRLRYLSMGSMALVMLTFYGTQSRGALLVWPIVLLIYFVFIPTKMRLSALISIMIVSIPSYFAYRPFIAACVNKEASTAFLWIMLVVVVTLFLEWLRLRLMKYNRFLHVVQPKAKALSWLLVLVLVLFLIEAIFGVQLLLQNRLDSGGTLVMAEPAIAAVKEDAKTEEVQDQESGTNHTLTDRREISIDDNYSAYSRLYWMMEGFREITLKHPIIGQGGGAWEASYKSFQSYDYSSTQVHNSWLQVLLEVGFLGFFSFAGIWLMMLWYAWKHWKSLNDKGKMMQITLVAAAFSLGGHALIDFDFSLSSFLLVLYALFALSKRLYLIQENKTGRFLPAEKNHKVVIPVLVVALLVSSGAFYIGYSYKTSVSLTREAVGALKSGRQEEGLILFEKASKWWPYSVGRYLDMATIYLKEGNQEVAREYLELAESWEPYNPKVYAAQLRMAWQNKDYDWVMDSAEKAVSMEPWENQYRIVQSDMYLLVSLRLLEEVANGNVDLKPQIMTYLHEATLYPETYQLMIEKRTALLAQSPLKIDPIEVPVEIINNAGAAYYILSDFDKASEQLAVAEDMDIANGATYFWLSLSEISAGNPERSHEYYKLMTEEDRHPNFNEDTIGTYQNIPSFLVEDD